MDRLVKFRSLYLLALFQLVAGPLVLVQVSALGKLTIREASTHGIARAVGIAWKSSEFQANFADAAIPDQVKSKQNAPTSDPKATLAKGKMPWIDWSADRLAIMTISIPVPRQDATRWWTPAWPQAPPGPPPREA